MSDTLTDSDVELFLDLELELESTHGCEHSRHSDRPQVHSDDSGTWLAIVFMKCRCDPPEDIVFCGKFKEYVTAMPRDNMMCGKCGKTQSSLDTYIWLEKLS